MNEFLKRVITAFVLIVFVYILIKFLPLIYFSIILFLIISIAAFEMVKMCNPGVYSFILIFLNGFIIGLSFTFGKPDLLMSIIIMLISTGLFFLFSIKKKEDLNTFVRDIGIHFLIYFTLYIPLYFLFELRKIDVNYLYFLIFVITIGDSGAYFIGSAFGRHKVYPIASPNKTLEGVISAIVFSSISGWLFIFLFSVPKNVSILKAVITGGIMGLFSQLSDPVESLFKRAALKKDSGFILPGHGGILDRLDSYIFCVPVLFFILKYFWK